MIGIDSDRRLFYEGSGNYGHGLWPSPFISVATVLPSSWSVSNLPKTSDLGFAKLVFREDVFDPVTRIRRGRFYVNPGTQPQDWHVQTHPAFHEEVGQRDHQGNFVRRLYSFQPWMAFPELTPTVAPKLIALGFADAFTLWKTVDIERIVTGEDLVTLRARTSMGLLPELNVDSIPSEGRAQVFQMVEKVNNAAYSTGPESLIDRCRDASQVCIGWWLSEKLHEAGPRTIELSPLLKLVEDTFNNERPYVLLNAGRIIALLHSRKPSEQAKRGTRGNLESDAEAALANFGLILRELKWAQ